jgi:hypothetical protein
MPLVFEAAAGGAYIFFRRSRRSKPKAATKAMDGNQGHEAIKAKGPLKP